MLSLPFTMAISSAGGTMDQRFMPIRTGFIQGVSKATGPRQFAVSISSLPTTHSPLCSPGTVYYSMFAHNAPSPLLFRATKTFLAIVSFNPFFDIQWQLQFVPYLPISLFSRSSTCSSYLFKQAVFEWVCCALVSGAQWPPLNT